MKTVKIMWLSRHEMTADQKAGLEKVYPNCDLYIEKVDKTVDTNFINAVTELDYDAFAVVLPVKLLAYFQFQLKDDQKLLVPLSKRILTKDPNGGESKVTFAYDGWEVIDELVYKSHTIK